MTVFELWFDDSDTYLIIVIYFFNSHTFTFVYKYNVSLCSLCERNNNICTISIRLNLAQQYNMQSSTYNSPRNASENC